MRDEPGPRVIQPRQTAFGKRGLHSYGGLHGFANEECGEREGGQDQQKSDQQCAGERAAGFSPAQRQTFVPWKKQHDEYCRPRERRQKRRENQVDEISEQKNSGVKQYGCETIAVAKLRIGMSGGRWHMGAEVVPQWRAVYNCLQQESPVSYD